MWMTRVGVNVASTDGEGLKKAIQMISDLTATPELGKTYLGKVVRLAEFGAFVEIFPGTDGLLHISEIAEHRVKEVKDELNEGDQILVKVLAIEGNRIKLSRKSLLREQREKLGIAAPAQGGDEFAPPARAPRPERTERPFHEDRQPAAPSAQLSNESTILIEGGDEFEDADGDDGVDGDDEPNFNSADGTPVAAGAPGAAAAANKNRRRRRGRGRGPGGPGGPGGAPGAGGGNRGPR